MEANILKVNKSKLLTWIRCSKLKVDYYLDIFPRKVLVDEGPIYWELSINNSTFWRRVREFKPYESNFQYLYFKFDTRESKERFLETRKGFPISKLFYEEYPLSLLVRCEILKDEIGYNFNSPLEEVIGKLKDYFRSDVSMEAPKDGIFTRNWTIRDIVQNNWLKVNFKTKDDLMMFKLSAPDRITP